MLETISWPAYAAGTLSITLIYYGWFTLAFYRTELAGYFQNNRQPQSDTGQVPAAAGFEIIGHAAPEDEQLVGDEELQFGPPDTDDFPVTETSGNAAPQQTSEISEMTSEVKTLIRVVTESSENRETFEMLFGLLIQKYRGISDTPDREKVNKYLLLESKDLFPFTISEEDLDQLWDKHSNL